MRLWSLAWLSTPWRHARLMMSKQAWRFVLKGRKTYKGGEGERK